MSQFSTPVGYKIKFQTVCIGDQDYHIRSLKDRMQYHDPGGECERAGVSSATWPLFGLLWPAGQILAEVLHHRAINGLRVLEVGCGLGLASLVAQRRGANITASDHHPLADEFLTHNAMLNDLPKITYSRGDWLTDNPDLGRFDLIIGSDLLYEPNQPEILSEFVKLHASEQASILVVDPGRKQQGKFSRRMDAMGFQIDSETIQTELASDLLFKGKLITCSR